MSSVQVQFILRLRKSESTVDDWKLHLKRQPSKVTNLCDFEDATSRAVTKALIGGAYSYIRVLPDEFHLKSTVMTTDFKRNSSGRTRIYEYPLPPPPPPPN